MTTDLDGAFIEVGDFGRYQIFLNLLLIIPAVFPSAFIGFSQVFISAVPDHWCAVPELIDLGVPLNIRKNLSIPLVPRDGVLKYSHCEMYNASYGEFFIENDHWPERDPSWPLVKCQHGWEYDRTYYDATLVTEFDLVCADDWWPSLAISLFYTGSVIGTILFGWITDKYGRKNALFINLFFAVLLPICSAFSPNYQVYTLFRFITGFVFPAIFQIPFILVMEFTSTRYRTGIGMVLNMSWGFAMVALSGIAALVREWFTLLMVTSAPFLIIIVYWWLVPESPRWLIAQKRLDEAEDILQNIAKHNRKQIPRNIVHKYMNIMEEKQVENVHPGRLLVTPNLRKKTILIAFIWLANSLVYTGLSYMSANLGVSDYVAFAISGFVEAPSCLIAWYAMEKWGRRWTTLAAMIFVGICCVGNVFVSEDSIWLNVLLPSLGKFGITGTFSIAYVFGGELLPTVVRGSGLALCSFVCGLGLIGSPYVIYLVVYSRVLPLLIMGLISIVGGMAAIFLPETLGLKLPETMEEGEEFGKNMTLFSCLPSRRRESMEQKVGSPFVANGVVKESGTKSSMIETETII